MFKIFFDKMLGKKMAQSDIFEKSSHYVDLTTEGSWASYTKFQALTLPTSISVSTESGIGDRDIVQSENTVTFKDGQMTARRVDNSCWDRTTVYLKTGTENFVRQLSSKTPEGKCGEIHRLFKSYPLASEILCTKTSDDIATVLQAKGHTVNFAST